MRIMGIDPGYAIVGVGLVDYDNVRFSLVEYGAITTPAELPFETRLRQIYDDMVGLITQYRPDAVAMEQLFFTTNRTTAIAVAEARGVLLLAAEQQGVPVFNYTPLQVKSAVVGYGKAEKEQVMEMTRRLLNLKSVPQPDDAADALAIAICHGHNGGSRLPTAALQGEENMIYSISGLLRQVAPTYCVVEACGVGYQCSASTHTLSSLPGRGQEVTLLTHLWVKEDGMELFGFSTEQERRCFRMLIGVSGVGPRVALAILSDSAPDRLMLSIAAGDAKALTRAQGVGAKLAQRIILELRDKVSDEDISMPFSDEIGTISTVAETIHNTAKSEAISALVALGYGQTGAAAVIAPMEDSLAVDELIRRALKSFTRGK